MNCKQGESNYLDPEYTEFKRRCGIVLNEQQDIAVQTVEGPVLLLAVPGSGKTTVLVSRLAYMVYMKEINPRNILTITYTVAATNDMKNRFISKLGDEYADALEFRTINGICQKILSFFGNATGKRPFDVADKQANDIIKVVFREVNNAFITENDIKSITTAISFVKNMRLSTDEIEHLDTDIDNFPKIYKEYNTMLKKRSLIDYDDQMVYALKILEGYPDILKRFQDTYRYICVDEAQDTSKIQHDIINLLSSKYHNLFMVGDEDQSIYGFRAAYPQGLLDFEKNHKDAKVLLMESNYRSNSEIVEKADEFIQKNRYRHAKKMNSTRLGGGCVTNIRLNDRREQYNFLLKVAQECESTAKAAAFSRNQASTAKTALPREREIPTTAVLYRNNESAIPLIDLFERNQISYKLKKSDMVFFSYPVVMDIVDILQFALNPMDSEIFMRIYYKIGASIKKSYAQEMVERNRLKKPILLLSQDIEEIPFYIQKSCRETYKKLNGIATDSAGRAVHQILHALGYENYINDHNMDMGKADILQILANNCGSVEEFLDRLPELQQLIEDGVGDNKSKFILSTIHSSKGLEYDNVYLMDMTAGILPSGGKPRKTASEEEKRLYEEERRLFYVAMTRAKNELYIFTFIKDITSTFCEELFKSERGEGTTAFKAMESKSLYASNTSNRKNSSGKLGDSLSYRDKNELSFEEVERKKMDFEMGIIVNHQKYGRGVVVEREDDKVTILFDNGKQVTLALDFVIRNAIMEPICGNNSIVD